MNPDPDTNPAPETPTPLAKAIGADCPEIAYLERLLAERTDECLRLKAERQWQPIETAPKDGTPVLGWAEDWIHPDYNREGVRECFCDGNGDWQSPDWNNYQDTYETGTGTPTHWMPIPRASIEIARKPCAIDTARTQEGQG